MSLPGSLYFSPREFASHDGVLFPEDWIDQWNRISSLADAARALWGGPLEVVSGYRSPAHNAALIAAGGHDVASASHHMEGLAVDLRPVGEVARAYADPVLVFHDLILHTYESGGLPELGGLGLYPAPLWAHLDVVKAPDGHLRRWSTR